MHRQEAAAYREAEVRAAHARGWAITPLRGKQPVLARWQDQPFPTLEQAVAWARRGNVGLRCGPVSGVLVVDEDTLKGGDVSPLMLPRTVTAVTGGGGRHYYFRAPDPCPGNSASKLGPHIDTRGDGGQVVFVGSVHPVTQEVYVWAPGAGPTDLSLAELPAEVLEALRPPQRAAATPDPAPAPAPASNVIPYARAALDAEYRKVAAAAPGTRNQTLNAAAFSLGQLVAGGILDEASVTSSLMAAAITCGLTESEARATVRSGLAGGAKQPRRPEPRAAAAPAVARRAETPPEHLSDAPPPEEWTEDHARPGDETDLPEAMVPGAHVDNQGEYHEVGNDDFARLVLCALPAGTIYRRGGVPGELVGDPGHLEFRPLTNSRLRVLIDAHVRCVKWTKKKSDGAEEPVRVYCPCGRDQAAIVLDQAAVDPRVRELRLLVSYPVFLGPYFELAKPGWNPAHSCYYDEPPDLRELDTTLPVARCRALLEDLTIDFPWKDEASRENVYGLLITALIRHALRDNVPMHLILSSIPRSGKTKIAEILLGGIILGEETPALQFSGTDEERDKRILGLLMGGASVVHLDNLGEFLSSAALASLLTSRNYSGRLLGQTRQITVPNTLTIVASGNNVRATTEIVKRAIPIQLQPRTENPERRTDFKHPDIKAYVAENRALFLSCLLSMVVRWRDGERELHPLTLGGFERWSQTVGGILAATAYGEWMTNAAAWARQADPEAGDLRQLVEKWHETYGDHYATARDLMLIAEANDLFSFALKAQTEKGRLTSFGMRVLGRNADAPVGRFIIRSVGGGNNRMYFLESQSSSEDAQ